MTAITRKKPHAVVGAQKAFNIPDLCKNTSVLGVVIVTQLWSIIAALLISHDDFLLRIGPVSFYCQWIALSTTFLLCFSRRRLNSRSDRFAILCTFAACLIPFLLTEIAAQYVSSEFGGVVFDSQFWSRFIVASILSIFMVRLVGIASVLEQRNKAEMESRVQALQSRIKPHFLFNSLNTIAELTATEPAKAEDAIQSLSILFRAGLETERKFHSLENELNLCRRYVSLERLRLEEKLQVDWSVQVDAPTQCEIPRLLLQPLVENAIVHGGSDEAICVKIDVRETKLDLSILVENNVGKQQAANPGHGIAIENIRERLFVLYDDRQTFRVRSSAESYSVVMRLPKHRTP